MAIAYRATDWPLIDSWGTPTFYFINHGTLVAKVTGGPKQGRRAELLAAAHQVALR